MRGERKRDYPANLFYQQPWWEDEREFADYQGRLCAFASEGERLTDILVLQPLASVWSEYSPLHTTNQFAVEEIYDRPFAAISHRLLEQKLDFHYGNENLMMTYGAVKNDLLYVGACFY
ncbi:MAG: glycoside hydrolase, partial [bacterium]|nr:glycoside hydrolase [bacterium]